MMFVSDQLRKGDIPHYFISKVNLAQAFSPTDTHTYALADVAKYIEDLVKSKDFPGKFISDLAVVHLMAFNPEEHQKIVSSREPEEEDDGRDNKGFSSIQETTM